MTDTSPTIVNRILPRRLANTAYRVREYLTEKEVERLIDAAKRRGRNGARDAAAHYLGHRNLQSTARYTASYFATATCASRPGPGRPRSIGNARMRSTRERGSISTAPPWATGWAAWLHCSTRWFKRLVGTPAPARCCTPTIRLWRFSPRGRAAPGSGDCGPRCATSAHLVEQRRRPRSTATPRSAGRTCTGRCLAAAAASCTPTAMPASTACLRRTLTLFGLLGADLILCHALFELADQELRAARYRGRASPRSGRSAPDAAPHAAPLDARSAASWSRARRRAPR
jgi:hypothetical protein